jgi:sugar (pentulose or hexulose) kinase
MGETGVLVDGSGEPVAPAIAWHDGRDTREVGRLANDLGRESFLQRTGKPLRGQFSITKHRWQVDHLPLVRTATRRFNVAEWVARRLGADEACDRTLACRTGWYDLHRNDWWDDALTWSGAGRDLLPPVVDSGTPIGTVSALPRLRGAVVTLAGHDHQAAAVGVGAEGIGVELDSSGTAEALLRTVPAGLPGEAVAALAAAGVTTDVSVQPGRWSLLGGTEGGLAMQRVLRMLGVAWDDLPALDDQAVVAQTGRLHVSGIGSETLGLTGVADDVTPGEVWRAVVETATAQAVAQHRAMSDIVGPHRGIIAVGGWCASRMVVQAKRDGFGPIDLIPDLEAGTRGAAILAARATGHLLPGRSWPLPVGGRR